MRGARQRVAWLTPPQAGNCRNVEQLHHPARVAPLGNAHKHIFSNACTLDIGVGTGFLITRITPGDSIDQSADRPFFGSKTNSGLRLTISSFSRHLEKGCRSEQRSVSRVSSRILLASPILSGGRVAQYPLGNPVDALMWFIELPEQAGQP